VPKHSSIFLFSKTSHPDVNHVPILETTYFKTLPSLLNYDYIIATSKETLHALDKITKWQKLPVLAISQTTADYVQQLGGSLLDVGDGYAKTLVELIKDKYKNKEALYVHAQKTAYNIKEALMDENIFLESWVIYKTQCSRHKKVVLPDDAICIFTSPSSVKCFEKKYTFLPNYKIVCIGETTASALPKHLSYVLSEKTSIESTIIKASSLL